MNAVKCPSRGDWAKLISIFTIFLCWFSYQIYTRPITKQLSVQVLLLGGALTLLIAVSSHILIFQQHIKLNRQIIALGILHIYSIVTVLWANWPQHGLESMKLILFLYFVLVAAVSSLGGKRQIRASVLFLIFMQLLSVGISFTLLLFYSPGATGLFGVLRKFGFDTQPNFYVLAVLVATPLLIHIWYHSIRDAWRYASLVLMFAGLGVVILSGSRVPFMALTLFLGGLAIFDHNSEAGWKGTHQMSMILFIVAVFISVLSLLTYPDLMGRLVDQTGSELSYLTNADYSDPGPLRAKIYLFAVDELFIEKKYLIGVGFGNFGKMFAEATGTRFLASPHNIVLKYLIETGVVGAALAIYVLLLPLRYGISSIRDAAGRKERSRNIAITWAYIMLLCFAAFQPILGRYEFYFLSALLFATYINSNEE